MPDGGASRPGRRRGTVRFRVTALAALCVLVVLTIASVILVVLQRRLLLQNVDEALVDQGAALVADLDEALARGETPPAALAARGDDDLIAQLVTADGTVVATNATATSAALDRPLAGAPPSGGDHLVTLDGVDVDDESYRLLSRVIDGGPAGERYVLHLATPLDDVEESIRVLAISLALVVPAAATVLAGVVWWLVGRTLRPVEQIRAEVETIGETALDRRVPQPSGQDEIARLAGTMNAMLDRLETSTRRQQQFVADASHELRTPLTRMRSELEVDLAHPATADPAATHRSVLEEIDSLQRLVEDLLLLAKGGIGHRADDLVDLDDVVLDELSRAQAQPGASVDGHGVSAAQVVGDADQLRRVVRNLLDNAVRHARSRVVVGLTEQAEVVTLTVVDDGPGIAPQDRERVFERFTRLDAARQRDLAGAASNGTGAGLGLAIARDVIRRHGGTIVVDGQHPGPGARLVVTLPAASPNG